MKKIPPYEELIKHTTNNDLEILRSKKCSCLFCRHTMDARNVQDWVDDEHGVTAICPECGMDTLIGDASGMVFERDELKEINVTYFGEDYMERHPEAARTYCERYRLGKITKKAANELLYIQYLAILSRGGDPYATLDLATLLEFGSEFTQPDPKTAFSYYASKCLSSAGHAYARMGVICESGVLGKIDAKGAFECYAKSMAFGCATGLIRFADCYSKGVFVEKNPEVAYSILSSFYPDAYARFVASAGKDSIVFAILCYRLGKMNLEGLGVEESKPTAIRFFLEADAAFSLANDEISLDTELRQESDDCFAKINYLGNALHYKQTEPTFDVDTLAETLSLNPYGNRGGFDDSYLEQIEYDEKTKTCIFKCHFGSPQFINDVASLFSGFVSDDIYWVFNDVVEARFSNEKGPIHFNRIYGNGDEGFHFGLYKDGTEEIVAEFLLGPADNEKEEIRFENEIDDSKGQA